MGGFCFLPRKWLSSLLYAVPMSKGPENHRATEKHRANMQNARIDMIEMHRIRHVCTPTSRTITLNPYPGLPRLTFSQ